MGLTKRMLFAVPAVISLALAPATAYAAGPGSHATSRVTPAYVSACPKPTATTPITCQALRLLHVHSYLGIKAGITPSGYGPSQLRSAYKLPSTGGAGMTVAITDVYNDPNAASDLAVYRQQFGLPPCTKANGCFSQVNQNLQTSPLPADNDSWATEESLDIDAVSAACPQCHIVLVEAKSASNANLYTAVKNAATKYHFVSGSWGEAEYSSELSDQATYLNHPGTVEAFSAGDTEQEVLFPSSSQYAVAVGGTTLTQASGTSRGWAEHAWDTSSSSGTGSGCSKYVTQPSWQNIPNITSVCAKRATADVSADADPNTGYAVYDTDGNFGWIVVGGTSGSVQFITGVYALAGTPPTGSYPASFPYAHAKDLYDITKGSTGSCGTDLCNAGKGWDGPTGMGTPKGLLAFQ